MPLHGVQVRVIRGLHGFDDPVVGSGGDPQAGPQVLDGLVVIAVGPKFTAVEAVKDGTVLYGNVRQIARTGFFDTRMRSMR